MVFIFCSFVCSKLIVTANLHLKNYLNLEKSTRENEINEIIQLINNCIDNIRNISHVLHPVALEEFGITFALSDFCNMINNTKLCQIESYSSIKEIALDQDKQLMLYRIIQELVINSVKHGNVYKSLFILSIPTLNQW